GSHTYSILDAQIIDVYKHTNAVIFVFDITKKWTFDYIKREINKVPPGIEILCLVNLVELIKLIKQANCRDLNDKRVVTEKEIEEFLSTCNRSVKCLETSMKNCYGLKQLYTYLNLPFLQLK